MYYIDTRVIVAHYCPEALADKTKRSYSCRQPDFPIHPAFEIA